MQSMTGYANAQKTSSKVIVEVSLRTVNNRYLDLRFHLPKELADIETDLRQKLTKNLRRGTVDIYVHWSKKSGHELELHVDNKIAQAWVSIAKNLAKNYKLSESNLTSSNLIHLPHVVQVRELTQLGTEDKKAVYSAFDLALKELGVARKREGLALKNIFIQNLNSLEACVKAISKEEVSIRESLEKRLKERLSEISKGVESDPQRFHQELIYQLDKMHVGEELDRLGEHLKIFRKEVQSASVKGKSLEFYCQEILREVNTIGSKIQDVELTQRVVEAKTLVEGLREQVQNVE